jgi:hypothetical protein
MPHFLLQVGKQALTTAAYAAFVSAIAACSGPSSVAYSPTSFTGANVPNGIHRATAYSFKTLDNPDDPAFNELLAINNLGKVGGYYGNGSKKNPSVGYIVRDFGNSHYRTKRYPGATDTVVTAVDNLNDIAGYYVSSSTGGTFGFIETVEGIWTSYKQPHTRGSYNITELLGLSDAGIGVGFYADANQHRHAFELIQTTGKFHGISPPGALNAVATGINGKGDVVGYYNKSNGATESFLLKGGVYTEFVYEGAEATRARSINWEDEIAGDYVDSSGNTHGFVLDDLLGTPQWTAPVDDPRAAGQTVVAGIENHHHLVGYYVDATGKTDGFLASPKR